MQAAAEAGLIREMRRGGEIRRTCSTRLMLQKKDFRPRGEHVRLDLGYCLNRLLLSGRRGDLLPFFRNPILIVAEF
jgi:hypothetical protein